MTSEAVLQSQKREALRQTQELLHVTLARIEEPEKQKTPPPTFVKANKKKPQEQVKKGQKEIYA